MRACVAGGQRGSHSLGGQLFGSRKHRAPDPSAINLDEIPRFPASAAIVAPPNGALAVAALAAHRLFLPPRVMRSIPANPFLVGPKSRQRSRASASHLAGVDRETLQCSATTAAGRRLPDKHASA